MSDHAELLAQLWARAQPVLEERLALLEAVAADASATPERREAAIVVAHQLVGSLGTYGRPRGTELAREIERLLQAGVAGGELAPAVAALRREIGRAPSDPGG